VACRAFCGVCLTLAMFGVYNGPMHGFIMSFRGSLALHSTTMTMGSCILLNGLT